MEKCGFSEPQSCRRRGSCPSPGRLSHQAGCTMDTSARLEADAGHTAAGKHLEERFVPKSRLSFQSTDPCVRAMLKIDTRCASSRLSREATCPACRCRPLQHALRAVPSEPVFFQVPLLGGHAAKQRRACRNSEVIIHESGAC